MASGSASATRDQHTNEPCPSTSAKTSPQRPCSSIFDCLAFIYSFFVLNHLNPVSATPPSTNGFEEVEPSPCTSKPTEKLPYDVFINHRGIDVKETLAKPLYNTLIGMGFRVFLDSEELKLGEFLPTAIEAAVSSAKLHIAIFSPNYAQSPWCLEELSFMLTTHTQIVPVFYHVQPDDVRYAKGAFADAFWRHEKNGRYTRQKLQEWKDALHIVSFLVGETIDSKE
ncbi:hypothetical protein SUGI_0686390 [Cryptomeria japonica]|nr:hypothetical protein SUGI_0686390 [Cryptomeria japonica]